MSGFLHINGLSIYYEEHGSGEPLILLHGNGEDSTIFAEQIAFLAPHFRIITIDSRGHGQSSAPDENLRYESMTDDVIKAMDLLQIDKFSVIGFSDGGILALLLAICVPERIDRMIVIGANYHPSGLKIITRVFISLCYIIYSLLYYLGFFSKKWRWKQQLMALMLRHPHIPENMLQSITAKTLLLVGDNDIIRLAHTEKLLKLIKNAELLVLNDCDHFVLTRQAASFNEIALKFLNKSL